MAPVPGPGSTVYSDLFQFADAIILAGGRGSRMGGVDKPAIVIDGRPLLDIALGAVAGCAHIAVIGPERPGLAANITQAQEDPPGSGPVAGIGAGLRSLTPGRDYVAIVAADLPFLRADAIAQLLRACMDSGAGAAFAHDPAGRPQYLVSVWRRAALRTALGQLETLANQPMKALVPADAVLTAVAGITDVDTAEDIRDALSRNRNTALSIAGARAAISQSVSPLPPQELSLSAARGGTLAGPVHAAGPLPRFDVAAMDGYAIAGPGPWTLRKDTGFAGGARPRGLLAGEAIRIATGAHVPAGTASVLRDEFAEVKDAQLYRVTSTPERDDVRRQGTDFARGALVAQPGAAITPALISAALSVEVPALLVRGPVSARVIMTGDEIRATGPLHPGQTRDSVGPVIAEYLSWNSIRLHSISHLRDNDFGFAEILRTPSAAQMLLVVGATGGGAADNLRVALAQAHAEIIVGRLAMKPGGSAVVAQIPGGPIVLGLPGNPYAAIAVLSVLAPALTSALTARPMSPPMTGTVVNAAEVSGPVARAVPVQPAPGGQWIADTSLRTTHLAGLIGRQALALVPPGAAIGEQTELVMLPH